MPDLWILLIEGRALGAAVLAGAAGGIVRTFALQQRSWRDLLINMSSGALCSLYLGPGVEAFLTSWVGDLYLEPANLTSLAGFLAGLAGITLAGIVIDFARARGGKKGGDDGK